MRVLFIDNLLYELVDERPVFNLQPHAGLMSLVAVARRGGHTAEVLDPKWELSCGRLRLDASLYDELPNAILQRAPDVVGFTALGCNFALVLRLAGHLKRRHRDLPILLGGPHATILHREILERFAVFDAVARHEAEETLLPLLDGISARDFGELPGVSYRSASGEIVCNPGAPLISDLDTLPSPAYDTYPIAERTLKGIELEAGRGCPFSCTFCSTATFFGRRYRLKSPERLVGEMDQLNAGYGFTSFSLTHDLFTVSRKKVLAFCEAVQGRGYTWSCSARVDCVDSELLRAMADAGCRAIYFGIETGSPRMQAISCKRLDLGLVEPTVALASELGIKTTTSFITGYPEEQGSDQAATLDMLGRLALRPDGKTTGQLHMLAPEPGTALLAQFGPQMGFDGHLTDFNFPLLDVQDERTVEQNPELFTNYHYYPTLLPRERHIFVTAFFEGLRKVPRAVARYWLRAFDGRLSELVAAADTWRRDQGLPPSPIDPEFFVSFTTARFSSRHHLVSLLRYAAAVRRIRIAAHQSDRPRSTLSRGAQLRLTRCSEILLDIHDCPSLLARISEAPGDRLLDDDGSWGRTNLLVKTGAGADDFKAYVLDHDAAALLGAFCQPKRYAQLRREAKANAGWSWTNIKELYADGLLEAA